MKKEYDFDLDLKGWNYKCNAVWNNEKKRDTSISCKLNSGNGVPFKASLRESEWTALVFEAGIQSFAVDTAMGNAQPDEERIKDEAWTALDNMLGFDTPYPVELWPFFRCQLFLK